MNIQITPELQLISDASSARLGGFDDSVAPGSSPQAIYLAQGTCILGRLEGVWELNGPSFKQGDIITFPAVGPLLVLHREGITLGVQLMSFSA